MVRAIGIAKAPSAPARDGLRYPTPPCLEGMLAMRGEWLGNVSVLVSVIYFRKKSSVLAISLRKGVERGDVSRFVVWMDDSF